jgi:hypothetical protein
MDFKMKIRPIDKGISKALMISLAVIVIAVGAAIFSLTSLLISYGFQPVIYGLILVWLGSMAFFYAVITEEHTLKELFLRQAYFFTGILAMILGIFFVSLGGLSDPVRSISVVELGVFVLILGAGMILFSAQRSFDYSKSNAMFSLFSGMLLIGGGSLVGSLNVAYAGIFIILISAFWLGMRDRYAQ